MESKRKKVKILYIEDDPSSRLLVRKILAHPPFEFLEADTGMGGLKLAFQEKPDVILMDINLPDIRGDELTTKIKNTPELKDIVVVALTAMKDELAREITLVAGCDGYLTKPIDPAALPHQILEFLRGARETLPEREKEEIRTRYEAKLVDHLAAKVEELEKTNRKLEETSRRLKDYNSYLEKALEIISRLQACANPNRLKKLLVDEIWEKFQYDRCVFIDVDPDLYQMKIHYAIGVPLEEWNDFSHPFDHPFFKEMFRNRQVILVRDITRVKNGDLRKKLQQLQISEFIFGYLGTTLDPSKTENLQEHVLPYLESIIPRLKDQEGYDRELILENMKEYFSSENFYRGGFIYIDNYHSRRHIAPFEYRFLETIFRTASYIYQNLLLMDELQFLFVRAEREAITDPLTNLFNYRFFYHQLKHELSRARRHQSHFSVIMIDIDFFKRYNDTFGHQAGDRVLQQLAEVMRDNTRSSDIVARYGGEEFVIISPELNKSEALKLATKLRQLVENYEFPNKYKLPGKKLTISLGIATYPEDGENVEVLIRKADLALYRAKREGRNRVVAFSV